MPGSPFARYPKALIATTRLPPRFGLARLAARKSGEIFWTELARHSGALRPFPQSRICPHCRPEGERRGWPRQQRVIEERDWISMTPFRGPSFWGRRKAVSTPLLIQTTAANGRKVPQHL